MRGNAHVRFGGRAGETDRRKRRHRAPVRPYAALRSGGTNRVLGFTLKAASTLGTFLRSFRWGHVRQLDAVSRELLARACAHDGYRSPGWYVVDTSRRPERMIAGPFYGRDDAVRRLAAEWPPEGNLA